MQREKKLIVNVVLLILCGISHGGVIHKNEGEIALYRIEVEEWLKKIDSDLSKFNSLAAALTWKLSTLSDEETNVKAMKLGIARNIWKNRVCSSNIKKSWLLEGQKRKLYLLCRGPKFTNKLYKSFMKVMGKMEEAYNSELCPDRNEIEHFYSDSKSNLSELQFGKCLYGEPDLERLIKNPQLTAKQLKWIWIKWHDFVGPKMKKVYPYAVHLQNLAAQNNGYHDMGEIWKEELEIPHLEEFVLKLYQEIRSFYVLLHAVTRHKLVQKYGKDEIDPIGPIPIHLLGNMWGQDWSSLIYLFSPNNSTLDLDKNILKKNWTVTDMVVQAEDMYASLGLPKMTEKFWKNSIFEENQNTTICHGTAANLFEKDDFRMLLCAKVNMEDFYVIHHEMGHIEYYMAYSNQPAIFQDGANSAFHESIGDAIMTAVMVPQHLHRLGLISDKNLMDDEFDNYLLLHQALSKIPKIAFSLIVDLFRWKVFSGKISPQEYNTVYWELNEQFRGIIAPEDRSERFFDIGGKFHVADNTPYIRYFLSSILQMELFESMCELSLYGNVSKVDKQSSNIRLNRCDIYGSRKVGKQLMIMMSKGSSQHWSKIMQQFSGKSTISVQSLLDYYRPVYDSLEKYVRVHNVPIGW